MSRAVRGGSPARARAAAARTRAPRARSCRGCRASLEGMHGQRVWCMACLAARTNRLCARRALARTRSTGAGAGRRIVDHAGVLSCKVCRKRFSATWHTRRPLFCPACRGERIAEQNRERGREMRARRGRPVRARHVDAASRVLAPLRR